MRMPAGRLLRCTALAWLCAYLVSSAGGHSERPLRDPQHAPQLPRRVLLVAAAADGGAGMAAAALQEPHGTVSMTGGTVREICSNTCSKARNEICEEGRAGKAGPIKAMYVLAYCDLGTDCEDCGPWRTTATNVSWEDPAAVGPLRYLQSRSAQVRVGAAQVPPEASFHFAYTNPEVDVDVSKSMHTLGLVERGISTIVYRLLRGRCVRPDGRRQLVVDVGSNFGWFALLAARLGCRVIAYEPVPLFRAFLQFSLHLNDLTQRVDVRPTVVSDKAGELLAMVVPSHGIWGTAGVDGLNIDGTISGTKTETIEVPSVRLDDEVAEDVLLMKVDVEGWEPAVFRGATSLLRSRTVENIIMEYSPGVPERHFLWGDMAAHPALLEQLIRQHGFRVGHIGERAKHSSDGGWASDPSPLREVTLENLKYDIEDIRRWKEDTLGCPTPPELQKYAVSDMCSNVPEGLNPRSFRSEFSHNTNIFASTAGDSGLLRLEGRAGFLDPTAPITQFFPNNSRPRQGYGLGGRPCKWLGPKTHVSHRCRCGDKDVCGQEEADVSIVVAEGRMPQNYVLP